tara:strand:- start:109 stop:291 length:183 start_codon:yes stop_codon:yes gene_type:complete
MKVNRRIKFKIVKVSLDPETWLTLRELARDLKVKDSDLIRACVDRCLPDLTPGKIEIGDC